MKHSVMKGFSFGLTSGIITTLGLIVGLNSSTHSASIIIGAILVIAIADSLSDALGIHISEESENHHSQKEIWAATISTFLSKFVFALTFIIPVFFLSLSTAIIVSIIWGLSLIAVFSYVIARKQKIASYLIVVEHLVIAVFVIVATHYIGKWITILV